jgi:hypothetical protein
LCSRKVDYLGCLTASDIVARAEVSAVIGRDAWLRVAAWVAANDAADCKVFYLVVEGVGRWDVFECLGGSGSQEAEGQCDHFGYLASGY